MCKISQTCGLPDFRNIPRSAPAIVRFTIDSRFENLVSSKFQRGLPVPSGVLRHRGYNIQGCNVPQNPFRSLMDQVSWQPSSPERYAFFYGPACLFSQCPVQNSP